MCFYLSRETPKPFIAEQDILVFKYGNKNYHCDDNQYTPYWQTLFTYLRDNPTKKIKIAPDNYDQIDEGYHAHISFQSARDEGPDIGLFIIPKGETYYLNKSDEVIVASQLIYKGKYYSKIGIEAKSKYKTLAQLKIK